MNSRLAVLMLLLSCSPIVADEKSELRESITTALISTTKDTDADVRLAAYTALKVLPQSDTAAEAFRRGVEDDDIRVRLLALSRLVDDEGPTDEVLDRLIRALDEPELVGAAMNMLIGIGEPVVPRLIDAIEGNNKIVKMRAAYILGKVNLGKHQDETIACVSALLKEKDSHVRITAIVTLKDIAATEFGRINDDNSDGLTFEWLRQQTLNGNLHRSKISGGWLVGLVPTDSQQSTSMVFIPDPDHDWDGKSLPT